MDVAVRDLKNRLSEYLRRVQSGEEVVITSRGKPIAQLGPLRPVISESSSDLRKRLAALPWISAGNGDKPRGASEPIRIGAGEKTLADIVREDRQ
jgi:prevent-host-death family protein